MSHKFIRYLFFLIIALIIIFIILLFFKFYIGQVTIVKQSSMYPAVQENDLVWVNKWFITTHKVVQRGEIIIFESPDIVEVREDAINLNNPIAYYSDLDTEYMRKQPYKSFMSIFWQKLLDSNKPKYLKRVIALPGEHVEIKNDSVYINGKILEEEYLQPNVKTNITRTIINADNIITGYDDFVVPENCIFALGDNRENSTDCRNYGCIPLEKVRGIVKARIFPFSKIGNIQ